MTQIGTEQVTLDGTTGIPQLHLVVKGMSLAFKFALSKALGNSELTLESVGDFVLDSSLLDFSPAPEGEEKRGEGNEMFKLGLPEDKKQGVYAGVVSIRRFFGNGTPEMRENPCKGMPDNPNAGGKPVSYQFVKLKPGAVVPPPATKAH